MNLKNVIESDGAFDPNVLFAMAKELGIKKIYGISSADEFNEIMLEDGYIPNVFEAKAFSVISAYIAKFGIDKEVDL